MTFRLAISRRALLQAVGTSSAAAAARAWGPQELAQSQVSKAEAMYKDQPKGIQRCAICLNFAPPDACRLVAGTISPNGWCMFFAGKENAE